LFIYFTTSKATSDFIVSSDSKKWQICHCGEAVVCLTQPQNG
jgi:hypothetical protein